MIDQVLPFSFISTNNFVSSKSPTLRFNLSQILSLFFSFVSTSHLPLHSPSKMTKDSHFQIPLSSPPPHMPTSFSKHLSVAYSLNVDPLASSFSHSKMALLVESSTVQVVNQVQGLGPSKPSDSGSSPNDTIYLCNFRVGQQGASKGTCTNSKNTNPLSTSLKATQISFVFLEAALISTLFELFPTFLAPFWVDVTQTIMQCL